MKKIFTLLVMLAAALGMQAQDTWTIAGDAALMGDGWNPASETNVMTTTDNIHYTLVKENVMLKKNTYYFKACVNGGWPNSIGKDGVSGDDAQNVPIEIAENGAYKITFSLDLTEGKVALNAVAEKTGEYDGPTESTVVLAGATAIFGESWKADAEANTMITKDGIHYTLQKTDVILEAYVNYEFKIVVDGQWNGNAGEGKFASKDEEGKDYPNIMIAVEENGKYTISFSVDLENREFTVEATKTGDVIIAEKTWTIAGSSEPIFGTTWDPTNTKNDMVKLEDGSFELIKPNIELDATEFQFKVCANHSWDESYGDGGENMSFTVELAGTYDVIFTFIPDSKFLTVELTEPDPAGISTVKTIKANNAIYNMQGQRINKAFRGIAIQNGRKMLMK